MNLKHEIKRELSRIDPPDLWERIQANADHDRLASPVPIDALHQRRPSRWLAAVAAVAILLALAGAVALLDDDQTVDTTPATDPPAVSGPPTTLAFDDLANARQFRVGNVVVTIQCTAIKSTPVYPARRDLVLGGVVADNPDDLATLDGVSVAVGDLLALIIRDDDLGRRVTLYDNTQWFGGAAIDSCGELVESVPTWVDGGFFADDIPGVFEVLP